jgi:hypothetical protein
MEYGPADINLYNGTLFPQNGSTQLVLDSAQANYDSCKDNNGYSGSHIEEKQLIAGLNFCVKPAITATQH